MTSFGETDIVHNSNLIGKVRLLGVGADSAIYPRLALSVGITMLERPSSETAPALVRAPYHLRDASGELRFAEFGEVVSPVSWAGERQHVRSTDYGYENQVRFVCDLDHQRLEQIERRRSGESPQFFLQFWFLLFSGLEPMDAAARSFRITIPRDVWLQAYSAMGGGQVSIIEVQYSSREAEQFQRAVARVRDARAKIANGDFDGAVALCRHAMDAFEQELKAGSEEQIKALLLRQTDDKRAEEYSALLSKLRRLTNFAHHEFGAPIVFSRTEALFVLRCTEAALALLGSLTTDA